MTTQRLFDKSGGYRKLASFTYATMIHLGTIRFCRSFIPFQEDALGKTSGQMIGAARSGRQNIIEASERAATSKETEIKLTDVAHGSLGELLGDYEIHLADHGAIPWSESDPLRRDLAALWLPPFEYTDDTLHDYWCYFHKVKEPFAPWLDNTDEIIVANSMIVIISRAMVMLHKQMQHLAADFLENGGFRERMHQTRAAVRDSQEEISTTPLCPECGKPMRQRTSRNGKLPGAPFWGCTTYPACRGTREVETEKTT